MGKDKSHDIKEYFAVMIMGLFFVVIHGLALIFTGTFKDAGMEAFENPDNPLNIVYILIIMLVFTLVILLIAKFWKARVIQILILGAIGYTSFYVIWPLLGLLVPDEVPYLSFILAIFFAVILVFVLVKYPEWYVIDVCGIIVGAGAIAIFGISLGIWLVLILLVVLAIYDAISVYKTKHMIDLADTVMDLKLPVLLVVPKIRNYSLIKETKRLKQQLEDDDERDAFFMGLGDIVMPGILVVAIYSTIDNGLSLALSVLAGTLVGFSVLMIFVMKGRPQAGLPCLNGGAIAGYFIGSFLIFGELVGLNITF